MERFESAVSRIFTSKISPSDSDLGRVREHANCLSVLGRELCKKLNFAADVEVRVAFSNIRLIEDPVADVKVIDADAKTPRAKSGTSQIVIRQENSPKARRRPKKAVFTYRRHPRLGEGRDRITHESRRRMSVKAAAAKWVKTVRSPKTAFEFKPITPPSPTRLTISSSPVGRAVGMVSESAFKTPPNVERPERPRPPSPSPLVVHLSASSAFSATTRPSVDNTGANISPKASKPVVVATAKVSTGRSFTFSDNGGGRGLSSASLPRQIRRRSLSHADLPDEPEFTFSPREFLRKRQEETVSLLKGNLIIIYDILQSFSSIGHIKILYLILIYTFRPSQCEDIW